MADIGRKRASIALENRYLNQADRDGWRGKRPVLSLQGRLEDLARFADFDLLRPVFMNSTLANGTVNEPAQVAHLELPCRALTLQLKGALFFDPTGFLIFKASIDPGEQKIEMPLRVNRDGPPSLLVTMNGLNRSPEQLRHLLLRLVQPLSDGHEFLAIHYLLQKNIQKWLT
jgi:hypothetical protein